MFTRAFHRSLYWDRSIQFIPPHPILIFKIHLIILLSMSRSSLQSLSFWICHQNPTCIPLLSHACYMPCPSHPPWFDHSNCIWWENKWWSSSLCNFSNLLPFHPSPVQIFSTHCYQIPSVCVLPLMSETKLHILRKYQIECIKQMYWGRPFR
jgi:hypothetical protein